MNEMGERVGCGQRGSMARKEAFQKRGILQKE